MSQKIKVYCLAAFTDDAIENLLTQLNGDSRSSFSPDNVRLELISWTKQWDGDPNHIFEVFLENQDIEEDFMFFLDRRSPDLQDFLVADIRAAKRASPIPTDSLAQWSVVEATKDNSATKLTSEPDNMRILFGRCGRDRDWHGHSHSGIKSTYRHLISGHITFDTIVHKPNIRRSHSSETLWISSVLDICDEAYSAQARLVQCQADLLCRELQANPNNEDDDNAKSCLLLHARDSRNSFCLSSPRWTLQA